ncbi:MAG: hypothetical protein OXO51_05220 [Gemmatimonadota bacterium]|nr:hypothetical protein [Gemmatimonadota bacterium]
MNSRLEQLEQLASKDPGDPFIQYAIALEYVSSHRLEEAAGILERLMAASPDYTAGYHQAGRVYEQLDRDDEARRCYEQGIVVAERQGDAKDLDEMREALAFLD